MAHMTIDENASEQVSICEALDRVLNKGVVITGELTISVADIDLVYLSVQALLTSVETARQMLNSQTNDTAGDLKT
jgi:hypothetical protein